MHHPFIIYLTPRGLALGQQLATTLGGELVSAQAEARQILQDRFQTGRPLICIMALGIVVRILGPLTRDKRADPPVVVVDEAGKFAISVLGGHEGGANALTETVARTLGAIPVISTASDVLGLPALDLIGRPWDWQIEGREHLTKLAAALLRGERLGVFQNAGRRDWWHAFAQWPENLYRLSSWPPSEPGPGFLAISDRFLPISDCGPVVVYRPPSLVLGVGCRRGVPVEEIDSFFRQVCQTHGFATGSLGLVATVSLKANEPGLKEFAAARRAPLLSYSPAELAGTGPVPTPSEKVRSKIGIVGVAEPAALLASRAAELLLPKVRSLRVTMALARREA